MSSFLSCQRGVRSLFPLPPEPDCLSTHSCSIPSLGISIFASVFGVSFPFFLRCFPVSSVVSSFLCPFSFLYSPLLLRAIHLFLHAAVCSWIFNSYILKIPDCSVFSAWQPPCSVLVLPRLLRLLLLFSFSIFCHFLVAMLSFFPLAYVLPFPSFFSASRSCCVIELVRPPYDWSSPSRFLWLPSQCLDYPSIHFAPPFCLIFLAVCSRIFDSHILAVPDCSVFPVYFILSQYFLL